MEENNSGIKIITETGNNTGTYSVTDIYKIDLFTDKYRIRIQDVNDSENEKMELITNKLFDNTDENEEYPFLSEMFTGSEKYTNYVDVNKGNKYSTYFLLCVFAAVVSLLICVVGNTIRKKVKKEYKESDLDRNF